MAGARDVASTAVVKTLRKMLEVMSGLLGGYMQNMCFYSRLSNSPLASISTLVLVILLSSSVLSSIWTLLSINVLKNSEHCSLAIEMLSTYTIIL